MWYSRETAPEPGNRFRLRLRCVRACVRSCVCVTIPQWLGLAILICQWSGRPAVRHPRSQDTFFAFGLGLFEDVQLNLTSISAIHYFSESLLASAFLHR